MTPQDWAVRLYPVAEGQAGYVTRQQAAAAGVDSARLARQVAAGRLARAASGVCRLVQFPASPHEDMMVVWLQTGRGLALPEEILAAERARRMRAKLQLAVERAEVAWATTVAPPRFIAAHRRIASIPTISGKRS